MADSTASNRRTPGFFRCMRALRLSVVVCFAGAMSWGGVSGTRQYNWHSTRPTNRPTQPGSRSAAFSGHASVSPECNPDSRIEGGLFLKNRWPHHWPSLCGAAISISTYPPAPAGGIFLGSTEEFVGKLTTLMTKQSFLPS
jgi:hypothetical protein